MLKAEFHERLVREAFGGPISDEDALMLLTLLHLSEIRFEKGTLIDEPDVQGLEGITLRHASACVAGLWPATDADRSNRMYWQERWQRQVAYGLLSQQQRYALELLAEKLQGHSLRPKIAFGDIDVLG